MIPACIPAVMLRTFVLEYGSQTFGSVGTFNFQVPEGVEKLRINMVAGGGGGFHGFGNNATGGGNSSVGGLVATGGGCPRLINNAVNTALGGSPSGINGNRAAMLNGGGATWRAARTGNPHGAFGGYGYGGASSQRRNDGVAMMLTDSFGGASGGCHVNYIMTGVTPYQILQVVVGGGGAPEPTNLDSSTTAHAEAGGQGIVLIEWGF